ncbi:MAG: hypothetical protein HYZ28_14570 [Myxococcales bacterium]|nr:hypothetical protein [Myxococcales bacterium]
MKTGRIRRWHWAALGSVAVAAGCLGAGANWNQKGPGSGASGVPLSLGEIAVSPDGAYVVSELDGQLVVGDPLTCETKALGIRSPGRLAFAAAGERFFVTSTASEELFAVDRGTGIVWRRPVQVDWQVDRGGNKVPTPRLLATPDGSALVLVHRRSVEVVSPSDGKTLQVHAGAREIHDADLLPHSGEIVLTYVHQWAGDAPVTMIEVLPWQGGESRQFEVPNCASDLVVMPHRPAARTRLAALWPREVPRTPLASDQVAPEVPPRLAFLAPSSCRKDPVSVIDLEHGTFLRNLPGFGPVTVAQDGSTVIAFMDSSALEEGLFREGDARPPEGSGRYHLMFIHPATLRWQLVEVGAELPRYALTPDGTVLLVDSVNGHTRVLDVEARAFRRLSGWIVQLGEYALSRDSKTAWVISDSSLYRIDIPKAQVELWPLPQAVTTLNILPDDRTLLLRGGEPRRDVHVFETASKKTRCSMKGPELPPPPVVVQRAPETLGQTPR